MDAGLMGISFFWLGFRVSPMKDPSPCRQTTLFPIGDHCWSLVVGWGLLKGRLVFIPMQDELVAMDVVTCTSAISACEAAGRWQEALLFLELMHGARIVANRITWNAAVSAAEKGSHWELAMCFLDAMQDEHVAPDCISCGSAISACQKSHVWTRAVSTLLSMQILRTEPDSICWSSSLLACSQGTAWAIALEVLGEMRQAQVPDLVSICYGADACHKAHAHAYVAWLLAGVEESCVGQLLSPANA